METNEKSLFGGLAGALAAIMSPQAKVDLATQYWLNRFKEEVVARRPDIVNSDGPDVKIMEDLAKNYLDPIKAAREYLLRVFNQPRAEDDTFDLDLFGDKSKMAPKDRATIAAMSILWDNDFLVSVRERAPVLGDKYVKDFDWDFIKELHKQMLTPDAAAAAYLSKMYPELVTMQ